MMNPTKLDEERDEIIAALPKGNCFEPMREPNAYVYVDSVGRLCILPKSGGWLAAMPENMIADLAPFSD